MSNLSTKNVNKQHTEQFNQYFEDVSEREKAVLEKMAQAYRDTYKYHITSQEEDPEYIEGTKKLAREKYKNN